MSTQCTGCSAEIIWKVTFPNKRRVPLDAKPEKCFVLNVVPMQSSEGDDYVVLKDVYTSHFVTCPKAGEFRRRNP